MAPFLLIFALPLLGFLGLILKGWFILGCPAFAFILLPLLDAWGGTDDKAHVQLQRKSQAYKWILYLYVIVEGIYIFEAAQVFQSVGILEKTGLIFSSGLITGAMGITVAHELMHKNDRLSVFGSEFLLVLVCYMHYRIEHVLGHHSLVGTYADPATARLGESYYKFFPRTYFGGIRSAWRIEKKRLQRARLNFWSWNNKMIWYTLLPFVFLGALIAASRWNVIFFFFGQSFVAISLLEVINYIEHYGLTREEIQPGRLERVSPRHSWESRRRVTNALLINLQLHSDHHIHPTKPYQELVSFNESPQLPAGYATMALVALVPPLFRKLMHSKYLNSHHPNQ